MSRTVVLHVGIAKTGTTFLQRRLFTNRARLEKHGVRYPGPGPAAHFLGSLDLRGAAFKGHVYEGVEGAWARLVTACDEFAGASLISHETLARAKPAQIERAVTGFATDDVRVVLTVRDIARQAPAVWQETLKNRGETPYDVFLADIFARWRPAGRATGGFWGSQDVEAVVERWAAAVGQARVTVVTVPIPGAERDELWRRFARAIELPDIEYADPQDTGNTSLGVAEAELLRRLNPLLAESLDWPAYDARIKRRLAEQVLAPLTSEGRLHLPAGYRDQVDEIGAAQVEYLRRSGVSIVGELEDLRPPTLEVSAAEVDHQPGDLSDGELLGAALSALAGLAALPPERPTPTPPSHTAASRAVRRLATGLRGGVDRLRRRR